MAHTLVRQYYMNLTQGNHKLGLENVYERENPILKNR
jgi:hypothetical protein